MGGMGVAVLGVFGLMAIVPSLGNWTRLRAGNPERVMVEEMENFKNQQEDAARSLKSTRNPQCTMPLENPCTLNTTAIGMVEAGYATFYDEDCETRGYEGCFTDNIPECRTCYLSETIYMAATGATEQNMPGWTQCPCCVPTTLEDGHLDIEVTFFDYSVFNISANACTDAPTPAPTMAPTPAPHPTPAPVEPTPAPTPAPIPTPAPVEPTPAPTNAPIPTSAPVVPTPTPTNAPVVTLPPTPAPIAPPTPVPSAGATEAPVSATTPTPSGADGADDGGAANRAAVDDEGSSDGGMSTGTKIGIGVGVALGVIILGLAGFGALKASGRA